MTSNTRFNLEDYKLPYRNKFSLASKAMLACTAMLLGCVTIHAADDQKLAVVNVSFVFEKYEKVKDVQKKIDAIHNVRKNELDVRGKTLQKANTDLSEMYSRSGQSEQLFDAVQGLRKQQFSYERDVAQLNAQIQKDYTREMREVLSDIRQAIKAHAEAGGFDMVLRSPDSDNPAIATPAPGTMKDPSDRANQTYLQTQDPATVAEVLERFNRNPVLFGSTTVDITKEVLERLNGAFMRRAITGAVGK